MTGRSLLVVPLPGLARTVPRLAALPEPAPFVSLLDPFRPDVDAGALQELRRVFADVVPFWVELTGASEFPGGPTYLAPRPSAPFRHLTHEVSHHFPEVPHRPTSFTDTPHVRVPRRGDETLEDVARELANALPTSVLATEAALWRDEEDSSGGRLVSVVATFPFGTSAA